MLAACCPGRAVEYQRLPRSAGPQLAWDVLASRKEGAMQGTLLGTAYTRQFREHAGEDRQGQGGHSHNVMHFNHRIMHLTAPVIALSLAHTVDDGSYLAKWPGCFGYD